MEKVVMASPSFEYFVSGSRPNLPINMVLFNIFVSPFFCFLHKKSRTYMPECAVKALRPVTILSKLFVGHTRNKPGTIYPHRRNPSLE
jgi:hypothetical protein